MPTVLITGASRGIGLEFARQYAAEGWRVLATCRDPGAASALAKTKPAAVQALDVTSAKSVGAAARALKDEAVDVLICNAGIVGARGATVETMDYESWEEVLRTNVLGPVRVAQAFAGNVLRGDQKKMVAITSRMGSIADSAGGTLIYRSSKTALNMAWNCLAREFAGRGVTAVMFHPGWVRTDMGGAGATLTPERSVSGLRATIAGLKQGQNGAFLNHDGATIPW